MAPLVTLLLLAFLLNAFFGRTALKGEPTVQRRGFHERVEAWESLELERLARAEGSSVWGAMVMGWSCWLGDRSHPARTACRGI